MSLIGGLRITDLPREVLHRILIRLHPNQVQTASRILGVPEALSSLPFALENLAPLRWNGVLLSKLNWVSLGKTYIAALLSSVLLCNGIIRIVFYNHKKFAERNNRRTNVYILTTDEQNLLLEASRVVLRRFNNDFKRWKKATQPDALCFFAQIGDIELFEQALMAMNEAHPMLPPRLEDAVHIAVDLRHREIAERIWSHPKLLREQRFRFWVDTDQSGSAFLAAVLGDMQFLDERCKHNNNHLHAERVLELVEVVVALVPITEGDGDRDVDNRVRAVTHLLGFESVRGVNWDVGMLLPNVCKRLLEVLLTHPNISGLETALLKMDGECFKRVFEDERAELMKVEEFVVTDDDDELEEIVAGLEGRRRVQQQEEVSYLVRIVESVVGRGLVDILEFILSHRRIGNDERVVAIKKAFYKAVSIQNGKMVDMLVDRFDALELVNEVKALDALLCVNPFAESMSFVNADAPGILRRLLQHPRVKVAEYLGMSGSRFFNTLEEDVLVQADLDPKFKPCRSFHMDNAEMANVVLEDARFDLITQDNRFLHDFIRGEPALLFRLLEDERVSEVDRNYFKFRSACYQGDFEAVKTLVQDKGVDPSRHSKEVLIDAITKFQGQPPLCREQNKNIVNLLLRDERVKISDDIIDLIFKPNTVFEPTFLDSLVSRSDVTETSYPNVFVALYARRGDADEIRRLAKVHSNRTSAGLISVVSTFEEAILSNHVDVLLAMLSVNHIKWFCMEDAWRSAIKFKKFDILRTLCRHPGLIAEVHRFEEFIIREVQDQQIEIGEDVADLFAETWRIEPELVNDVLCLASEVGLVEVLKRIVKKDDVKALGNLDDACLFADMAKSFRQHEVLEVLMEAFVGEI